MKITFRGDLGNSRFKYPHHEVAAAIKAYNEKYIERNRAVGCIGGLDTFDDVFCINLEKVSHLVTELTLVGKRPSCAYEGTAKVLDTPMGKVLKALIEEGVELDGNLQGTGYVKGRRAKISGYKILSVNMVPKLHNGENDERTVPVG